MRLTVLGGGGFRVPLVYRALAEGSPITEFVLPGHDRLSAALDVGRTIVRRAERQALALPLADSQVGPYLNRLSDLLWTMARWQEHGETLPSRAIPLQPG